MPHDLTPIAQLAAGRLVGVAADGHLRLVWDEAQFRLPIFDLPHLIAVLDAWEADEELPFLRRGYYQIVLGPNDVVQLWLQRAGLLLSRDELRHVAQLLRHVTAELANPICRQPSDPLGLGYRQHKALHLGPHRQN